MLGDIVNHPLLSGGECTILTIAWVTMSHHHRFIKGFIYRNKPKCPENFFVCLCNAFFCVYVVHFCWPFNSFWNLSKSPFSEIFLVSYQLVCYTLTASGQLLLLLWWRSESTHSPGLFLYIIYCTSFFRLQDFSRQCIALMLPRNWWEVCHRSKRHK